MSLLLALAALAVAIALHGLLVRLWDGLPRVPGAVLAGLPVGIGLLAVLIRLDAAPSHVAAAALCYGLGIELYVFLFTLIANSVTLGLAMRLGPGGGVTYDTAAMVERRLEQLRGAGLLEADGAGGWRATAKGERLVATFDRLRRFFRHPDPS